MNLMMAVMFSCIGLGLVVHQWRGRANAIVAGIAVIMTLLYYFTNRFM